MISVGKSHSTPCRWLGRQSEEFSWRWHELDCHELLPSWTSGYLQVCHSRVTECKSYSHIMVVMF